MSNVADAVKQEIVKALEEDKLVLPTLPEVALKVREVAEDPDASIQDLGKVIGNDAALTARIVKVANSPLIRGSQPTEDLNMALMRLGMEYTCNIATGLAMEQMFQATSDVVDKRMRQVWQGASEIAGICHVLCKHYTQLRPDQATLAGLVHQIGILPILTYAENHPTLLKDSITIDAVIQELGPKLGDMILEKWAFPAELCGVPSNCVDFTRTSDAVDYADLVTVALLQSHASDESGYYSDLDYNTVSAFERVGLDPNIQHAEGESLNEEMEAAMALLQ